VTGTKNSTHSWRSESINLLKIAALASTDPSEIFAFLPGPQQRGTGATRHSDVMKALLGSPERRRDQPVSISMVQCFPDEIHVREFNVVLVIYKLREIFVQIRNC